MKPVEWLGDSLERVRAFPAPARQVAGRQLGRVQSGREPARWKPMPSVGLGVSEIKVKVAGEFRLIYIAKFPEMIYVLHAFQKKSRKTARLDIEAAKARYRTMLATRQRR